MICRADSFRRLLAVCLAAGAIASSCQNGVAVAAVDPVLEEQAIRAAVERVAASTVRIEVIGLPAEGEVAAGAGPSTGLVVGAEGWIVTTSFAVTAETVEVIVVMPDGTRSPAKVVGRDPARTIVLLKIDAATALPVPTPAPASEVRVGRWAIALGRAWNASQANVSVGVISALGRGWGRAVQTDAAVSPANYGGPLVDIHGRVIGVLAPIPADTAGMNVGTELYDSGIGFAVPLEDVLKRLPALQAGKTILPGLLGITYTSRDLFSQPPVIATARAGAPAAKAGFRTGDRIVAANGRDVTRIAELRHVLGGLSAGDSLRLAVVRKDRDGEQRIEKEITLAGELPPYRRPSLGIGLDRIVEKPSGDRAAVVTWVWPDGPAAKAGILPGDRILSIDAEGGSAGAGEASVKADSKAFFGLVAGSEIGGSFRIVIDRGGSERTVELTAAAFPAGFPPESLSIAKPEANAGTDGAEKKGGGADEKGGRVERLGGVDVADPPIVVLPRGGGDRPIGVLVFLGARRKDREAAAASWQQAADASQVAILLPSSANPVRWTADDVPGIAKAVQTLAGRRPVDRSRIAVAGMQAGGSFAWTVAESLGNAVRGVAILDAGLPVRATIPAADPGRPLSVVLARPSPDAVDADSARRRVEADVAKLEKAGIPVGMLPKHIADPIPYETICRWVETLGML